jgi:hypothetical protein
MSINIYPKTQRNIPEDLTFRLQFCSDIFESAVTPLRLRYCLAYVYFAYRRVQFVLWPQALSLFQSELIYFFLFQVPLYSLYIHVVQ